MGLFTMHAVFLIFWAHFVWHTCRIVSSNQATNDGGGSGRRDGGLSAIQLFWRGGVGRLRTRKLWNAKKALWKVPSYYANDLI